MNDVAAKLLVDSLPGMTPQLSLLTRAVARLETFYGEGWKESGVDSHNWGAITGRYKGQSFQHRDSRYDEKTKTNIPYTTNFRAYPSDVEGAADLARLLNTKYPSAVSAVPDWPMVSRNLYGYYIGTQTKEKAILVHAGALEKHAKAILSATGESLPDTTTDRSSIVDESSWWPTIIGVGLGVYVLLRYGLRRLS